MKIAIQIHADNGKASHATFSSVKDAIKQLRLLDQLKAVDMVEVDGVWISKEEG